MPRKPWETLLEDAGLPGELAPGQSLVELAGQSRALIEGHGGITEYGAERIRIRVRFGQVCICGSKLELISMTKEQLVISGRIHSVTLEGRNGP